MKKGQAAPLSAAAQKGYTEVCKLLLNTARAKLKEKIPSEMEIAPSR